jgi:tetratricopeptide (TPR) repeat protein
VRSSRAGWREKALRWFTRRPLSEVPLVFTDDASVGVAEPDAWLAPPAVPLAPGVEVRETIEPEKITITTNRPGHPLLVKVAWHPRWRAEGALGPYLVAPALMLVVPQQETVRLVYARTGADRAGLALSLVVLAGVLTWLWWRRRKAREVVAPSPPVARVDVACGGDTFPKPPRRWGGAVPAFLLALLAAARLFKSAPDRSREAQDLYELASRAYADDRFADAAEYARHGAARVRAPLRDELLCLRGESLLRAAQPSLALDAFEILLRESPDSPYTAQALFSGASAREAAGDAAGARADRERLLEGYPETPWARRLSQAAPP